MSLLSFLGISDVYAAATTAPSTAQQHGSVWQMLLLPVLLILVFYFLLIRPQSKRAKDQRNMLEKIGVGDEVMTAGGILGKVVRLKDSYIIVRIAKNVEVTLQKSSIATVLPKGTVDIVD
ncbi:MAG: preprotein translocase subunit YajC [Gammaproteobacteria bacterium RIFCSPHIGHO2_12_FULL_41_15]|nr:MAG: preprotein translocase subunit YajC [Gammaproteobacteria bacterium RIFCSPHIGHO2_12_FULL_41_15]